MSGGPIRDVAPRRDALARAIAASLGAWQDRATATTQLLLRCGVDIGALEASVRGGAAASPSGARMMVERLRPAQAAQLLDALGVAPGTFGQDLLACAQRLDLPVIGGWDACGQPVAKLYLNASDASAGVRGKIRDALLTSVRDAPPAPHVIGLNIGPGVVTLKLYEQHDALPREAPAALQQWTKGIAIAGAVRSVQIDEERATSRAWFVAMRPSDGAVEDRLHTLPGWDDVAVAAAIPFAPGPIKSVGFSSDGERWTVYFKPRGDDGPSWRLEPEVCLSDGATEVGIYLAPRDRAPRAYRTTSRHAISYRVRQGSADPRSIEPLMTWAVERVAASEHTAAIDFSSPPRPWVVVQPR